MSIAYEKFLEIEKLPTLEEKQRAWLKDYEGLVYSRASKGKHKDKWNSNPLIYSDDLFEIDVNTIKELKTRTRIEFDDKNERGEKQKEKIAENIEKTIKKLKENNIGFIRSTHNGASDYLWVEFNKEVTEKEKEAFLYWIAPEESEVDLNFASHKKVFPVLYAKHWKHSYYQEIPVDYFEGEKIDLEKLGVKVERSKIMKKKIMNRSFEYVTGIKKASKVFEMYHQAEKFNEIQPIFYDRAGLFWLWNEKKFCWEVVDEVDLLNMIKDATGKDVITSKSRTEIINSLKQIGRKSIPKPLKRTAIQFKDTIYDVETGDKVQANPEIFVTNPVPYEVSYSTETPNMDRIFEEWVGKEYVQTLYEILAYCILPDYPIHRIFCFVGAGLNGKSKFLELLRKFVDSQNCCSTELDRLLVSRFEVTRLHKKLVCQMGETNFNEIDKTSLLKQLSGGDLIGFEYKNKNPFEERNYAKILIATNNLPTTSDKTVGFYRRWLIIDFPNQFSEKKNILDEIPEEEYNNLSTKCLMILNELLEKREFTNEGNIEERMKRYEDRSNPISKFIKELCSTGNEGWYETKNSFYKALNEWLKSNRHREMSEKSVANWMLSNGFEQGKAYIDWWENGILGKKQARVWFGVKFKTDKTAETGIYTQFPIENK